MESILRYEFVNSPILLIFHYIYRYEPSKTHPIFGRLSRHLRKVLHITERVRILHQNAGNLTSRQIRIANRTDQHLQSQIGGARLHHGQRLRMNAIAQIQRAPLVVAPAQRHRFGGGGALVQQRCVRNVQPGDFRHHRLVVEQRLESALSDFRLVRCVLRRPAGILENVAHNRVRHMAIVVAHADVRAPDLIAFGNLVGAFDQFVFVLKITIEIPNDSIR